MKVTNVLGYPICAESLDSIYFTSQKQIINTLNAYSYIVAKKDDVFQKALKSSDILVADGFPVVIAAKLLNRVKIQKIAGEDIFYHFLKFAQQNSLKCFFLGASDKTLNLIQQRLQSDYPDIEMGYYSPPFVPQFSPDQSETMCNSINNFNPDILFIGMTAPKQEKWVYLHKEKLNAKIICSIGAVFDFYAGTVKRPSAFWVKLHLEWFVRLVKEPKRLWKRYLIYSPIFFRDLTKDLLKKVTFEQ